MSAPDGNVIITVRPTEALSAAQKAAIIDLCLAAHEEEAFRNLFVNIPSARHFMVTRGSELVSHGEASTRWLQPDGERELRTAYVDAVSTLPSAQGLGYGSAMMRRLAAEIDEYEIACLQTDKPGFYERLGWELWRGPFGGRAEAGFGTDTRTARRHGVAFRANPADRSRRRPHDRVPAVPDLGVARRTAVRRSAHARRGSMLQA